MDTAALLAKIAGLVLLAFTIKSVHGHIMTKLGKGKKKKPAPQTSDGKQDGKQEHSKAERLLNAVLLYAWFVFMFAFSLGMIFNN